MTELAAGGLADRSDWQLAAAHAGARGVVRAELNAAGGPGQRIVVTLAPPGADAARRVLDRAGAVLAALAAVELAPSTRSMVPVPPLAMGEYAGWGWLLQRGLPGTAADRLVEAGSDADREWLVSAVGRVVAALHLATAQSREVEGGLLDRWLTTRISRLVAIDPASSQALDTIHARVAASLEGATLTASWVHGDLWPNNVLIDRAHRRITGLVDWESAAPDEHPCQDALHLVLMTRRLARGGTYGDQVRYGLADPAWTEAERLTLRNAGIRLDAPVWSPEPPMDGPAGGRALPGRAISLDDALALAWLRQIVQNVVRQPTLARDRAWVRANVTAVADSLATASSRSAK